MSGYIGEGLIECHDCGAMVPSFESLIDLPGAPEHMTPCFRPVRDATMHNPGCTYCHDPETQANLSELLAKADQQEQVRNKLTVGELLDAIDQTLNPDVTTNKLLAVAEIGKTLLYSAICIADEQDNPEFFEEAYGFWGPLVDAVLEECGLDWRDSFTGRRRQRANDER
jgi:hypothetical protein